MSLLSAAGITSARRALEVTLVHRCTVTPVTAGGADSENTTPLVAGAPVAGVPCAYGTSTRVARDEGGTTVITLSTLMASATGPVVVGSLVSAITDQLGRVLLAGPARVERVLDDTAGLGASLVMVYEIRAAGAS